MELVYLWVEDYKNIKKQGFNFSPKFHCEFKDEYDEKGKLKDNCKLIVKPQEHIENFFGDNINVTAIVGKNGSGKSNVLEAILELLAEQHDYTLKNYILLYKYNNIFYSYSDITYEYKNSFNIEKTTEYILKEHQKLITILINNQYEEPVLRDTQQLFIENNKYEKNHSNKIFISNYLKYKDILVENKERYFFPITVTLQIRNQNYRSVLHEDRDYYEKDIWDKILELIKELESKPFIEKMQIIKQVFDIKREKHKKVALISFGNEVSSSYFYKYIFNKELLKKIPKSIQDNDKSIIELDINEINEEIFLFLKSLPYIFDIDLLDKDKKSFDSLSFGEKQLLLQLHYILYHSKSEFYEEYHPPQTFQDEEGKIIEEDDFYENHDVENILILLDEFEIGLHPEWQKKAINYIINFLKLFNKNIHLCITSHSPFLLSDIPKQNIIFLDKDENENCIVVDGLKEKKQTFGANIHTLLSDSFFMEDGLMGEFAKSKIDKTIKLLNQEKLSEDDLKYCEQIISIIGEPIVKNQLQRMLDSKRLSKIDAINQKIKNMSYELEVLKQHQSKIVQDELQDRGKKQYKERFIDDKNK